MKIKELQIMIVEYDKRCFELDKEFKEKTGLYPCEARNKIQEIEFLIKYQEIDK